MSSASKYLARITPLDVQACRAAAPGLMAAGGVALLAYGLHALPAFALFSPLILAVTLGVLLRAGFGAPRSAEAGLKFSQTTVLRVAVMSLGLQVAAQDLALVGLYGVAVSGAALIATFFFARWLGARLGVSQTLTDLIAAGTAICGAAAIVAVSSVRNQDKDKDDIACAIAMITLFGTIAMLAYPLIGVLAGMDARAYGLWTGASVHEVAQVAAAGFQNGAQAGQVAVVAKLARVLMLAPLVYFLARAAHKTADSAAAPPSIAPPWFITGFIAVFILNSLVSLPSEWRTQAASITTMLMAVALAAVGLNADLGSLRRKGWRPIALAAGAAGFIALFAFVLVKLAP